MGEASFRKEFMEKQNDSEHRVGVMLRARSRPEISGWEQLSPWRPEAGLVFIPRF